MIAINGTMNIIAITAAFCDKTFALCGLDIYRAKSKSAIIICDKTISPLEKKINDKNTLSLLMNKKVKE